MLEVCSESRIEGLARRYTKCHDRLRYVGYKNDPVKMGSHMSNVIYINFESDIFVHGSSQFSTVAKEFPGPEGFNFEPHFLKKIQHIVQLPSYRTSRDTFSGLWMATVFDALIFRTSIWENLQDVSILINDYSKYTDMNGVSFDRIRRAFEKHAQDNWQSFPTIPGSSISFFHTPLRTPLPPAKFELTFKWTLHEGMKWKTMPCEPDARSMWSADPAERADALAEDQTRYAALLTRARAGDQVELAGFVARHRFGSC